MKWFLPYLWINVGNKITHLLLLMFSGHNLGHTIYMSDSRTKETIHKMEDKRKRRRRLALLTDSERKRVKSLVFLKRELTHRKQLRRTQGWKQTLHCITKTRLFKYIEYFTTKKKWKFSDKKFWYFSYFCSKHRLWVLVRTASSKRF